MNDGRITSAELINEGRRFHADLRVRGDRIERIDDNLDALANKRVFDTKGHWLLPA